MNPIFCFISLMFVPHVFAQNISGLIKSASKKTPLEYVNIAILHQNYGTVSDAYGEYSIHLENKFDNDTLVFSCIGFYPFRITVADLRQREDKSIFLKEKQQSLTEVTIKPKKIKEKVLGITAKSPSVSIVFFDEPDGQKGNELGILLKTKRRTYLKTAKIHVAYCPYDTFFYRLNIYKVPDKVTDLENILSEPIYIKMPKNKVMEGISIDLTQKNIVVEGDFLITLENIKNTGNNNLSLCAALGRKTYYRKNFQSEWQTIPAGISISVVADVEQ